MPFSFSAQITLQLYGLFHVPCSFTSPIVRWILRGSWVMNWSIMYNSLLILCWETGLA
jgi:hypothetical protein